MDGRLTLALDTATPCATVCVCRGERVLGETAREVTTHSEGLLELIDEALGLSGSLISDVEAIVCGRGPGSFTGVRIGMATAKGLALATGAPLYAVSSLVAQGLGGREHAAGRAVLALIDARRGEVFGAVCEGDSPDEWVATPDQVAARAPSRRLLLVGGGALLYQRQLIQQLPGSELAPDACHALRARFLVRAAQHRIASGRSDDLVTTEPQYLRGPDIRKPAARGGSQPTEG